ncbi:hypothetical protein BHE74_00055759, partial [Ensete ventricosum]
WRNTPNSMRGALRVCFFDDGDGGSQAEVETWGPQGDASPLMGSEGEEMGQKEKEEGIWKRPFSPSSAPCRFFTRLLPPLLLCAILPPRFP